jgi:hypothetical protein
MTILQHLRHPALPLLAVLAGLATAAHADTETGPYIAAGLGAGAQHFESIGLKGTGDPDEAANSNWAGA